MDKETAKRSVAALVEKFSRIPQEELDALPEEQVKFRFIEPLLDALGWQREDIEKEKRVLKGRADYLLRLGNQDALVIEAKRTGVSLSEEEGRQAVSYAYHRKVKFAVLTNFKELKVYHALSNIKDINKNLLKDEKDHYLRFTFEEYLPQFNRLWLLSRESVEKGELQKLLSTKDERAAKPIDESILDDLFQIQKWLSKDLKKRRMQLAGTQIEEIVQMLIDRFIFIRSVEDRGLEPKDFLLNILDDFQEGRTTKRLWEILKEKFREFDGKYNSKLFHPGLLEQEGFFDDETLTKAIRVLYFSTAGHERYMFDDIPGDLLGNIYEQYLGTILSETDKRIKLKEGSGKRKKMGIYYTPAYIVDYIVKNTVGAYLEGKTLDEILDVKIVDPACGSGSFLIRAFAEVCSRAEARMKAGERSKRWASFKEMNGRLSLPQKSSILLNCIYGVDLDEKAVELAQLNLLLKLLEDETAETRKRILPLMKDNIKCGNSLIDDAAIAGDKAFNWHAQFPDIFKRDGFDVVIGNPPYILLQDELRNDKMLKLLRQGYAVASYKVDTYHLFIEKGINLLKNNGYIGYIVPSNFLTNNYLVNLRKFIFENTEIKEINSLPASIFEEASVNTAIFVFEKTVKPLTQRKATFRTLINAKGRLEIAKKNTFLQNDLLKSSDLLFKYGEDESILTKIDSSTVSLRNVATVNFGMQLRDRTKFPNDVIQIKTENDRKRLTSKHRPCLTGKDVNRYHVGYSDLYCYEDLSARKGGCWDLEIHRNKNKIVIRQIGKSPICGLDTDGRNCLNTMFMIVPTSILSSQFLLGVVNSKLLQYYWVQRFYDERETFPKIKGSYLLQLPIHTINLTKKTDNEIYEKIIFLVEKMLELQRRVRAASGAEKERLEQQIKNVDYEIDQEIYRLYGITDEERKIIEDSLK